MEFPLDAACFDGDRGSHACDGAINHEFGGVGVAKLLGEDLPCYDE